jgi:hypothetical protein
MLGRAFLCPETDRQVIFSGYPLSIKPGLDEVNSYFKGEVLCDVMWNILA